MRYFFSGEDDLTRTRASAIRAALVHAHHDVIRGKQGDSAPASADVWMYGLGHDDRHALPDRIVQSLLSSTASIVLYQLCDAPTMWFNRIPHALADRVRLFLRNHWPTDKSGIPEAFHGRLGWLPPMMKRITPNGGHPLRARSGGAIFFGMRTGFANMPDAQNARETLVRTMRRSGIAFQGGISPNREARYRASPELVVERMSDARYGRLLSDSKICLAPWGNHPLTYRLFEGLARRCLVVAQSLRQVAFLDGGLKAGKHYVEVAPDLHDLADVVRYYLEHLEEAQHIADTGHEHFRQFFAPRGRLISSYFFESSIASWQGLYRSAVRRSISTTTRSLAAMVFADRF